MLKKKQRKHGKKDLDSGKLECPEKIFDIQTESINQQQVFLDARMPLQLTPDQHLSAAGDAKVMATMPDSVEHPYHPIQFRSKEHTDQESMVKSLCNHEFDSHEGENEYELVVKVQNSEDFEQSNLSDEHISVSELNKSHTNVKGRLKVNVTFWNKLGLAPGH